MFKDVELSRDVMASFRESSHARAIKSDVELSVHVLTQGYWPTYPPVEVNLPQEVLQLQEVFNSSEPLRLSTLRLSTLGLHGCSPLGLSTLGLSTPW